MSHNILKLHSVLCIWSSLIPTIHLSIPSFIHPLAYDLVLWKFGNSEKGEEIKMYKLPVVKMVTMMLNTEESWLIVKK